MASFYTFIFSGIKLQMMDGRVERGNSKYKVYNVKLKSNWNTILISKLYGELYFTRCMVM